MSWANLVRKTIPTSSSSTSSSSVVQIPVQTRTEPILSQKEIFPPSSRIRLASLKECLDYRHSGHLRENVLYFGISGKARMSLSTFYRLYHHPLQLLYKNRIQTWCQKMECQPPSLSSFVVLAWIFSD